MTFKKAFIILLVFCVAFCLVSCSSRKESQTEKRKGARENVVISENPITDENRLIPSRLPEPSESSESEKDLIPEKTAESLLAAIKSGVREDIQLYADYNTLFKLEEGQSADWLLRQVLLRLNYEVVSSEVGEDKAEVTTKVSNLDMNLVLPLYFEQAAAVSFENATEGLGKTKDELDAEYRKIFVDLLTEYEGTRFDRIAIIEFEKAEDTWRAVSVPELGNAVLGGFLDAQDRIRGDMSDKSSSKASSKASSGDEYSDISMDDEVMVKPNEH